MSDLLFVLQGPVGVYKVRVVNKCYVCYEFLRDFFSQKLTNLGKIIAKIRKKLNFLRYSILYIAQTYS